MSTPPDPAVARFFALQIVRLSGAVFVLLGILIQAGNAPEWLGGLPTWTGFVFVIVGMIEFFALPRLLARRWKSPTP